MSLFAAPTLMHEIDKLNPREDVAHERAQSMEETLQVIISPDDPSRNIQISSSMSPDQQSDLVVFLHQNRDVLA